MEAKQLIRVVKGDDPGLLSTASVQSLHHHFFIPGRKERLTTNCWEYVNVSMTLSHCGKPKLTSNRF
jgi:hypothetical protein